MNIHISPNAADIVKTLLADAQGYHGCKTPEAVYRVVGAFFPKKMLLLQDGDLSIHVPSGDGASGKYGHLGRRIALITD